MIGSAQERRHSGRRGDQRQLHSRAGHDHHPSPWQTHLLLAPEGIAGWREQPNNCVLPVGLRRGRPVGPVHSGDGMESAGVIWISTGHWSSLDSTPGQVPRSRPSVTNQRHPRRHLGRVVTSPSLVEAVLGSISAPGERSTCRSQEAPDQRLPRGATHSCSAPPTAPTRSKSAS
jgi:hypothetical protein